MKSQTARTRAAKSQCTKAVILAAGCGSRVRSITPEKPKCLMDLGGRPIIDWILEGLAVAGIKEVVVVTGFQHQTLRRALGPSWPRDARTCGRSHRGASPDLPLASEPHSATARSRSRHRRLAIAYIRNPRWREPNGISLYAARRAIHAGETFLLVMSDHLLPPRVISQVARARASKCILAVDPNLSKVFDLPDATKVRVVGGLPVAIGKRLRSYDAVDCGLFRLDRRVFAALRVSFAEGVMSLSGGVKQLIANGDLEVLPIGKGAFWLDIDTPRAYKQALKSIGEIR
ncbi:MAG: NTP transferase domain-containing protein [Candidatus Eisenbacteria bacterium]